MRCVTLKHLRSGSRTSASRHLRCSSLPSVRPQTLTEGGARCLGRGWHHPGCGVRLGGGAVTSLFLFTTGSIHEEFSQLVVDAVKVTLALPC